MLDLLSLTFQTQTCSYIVLPKGWSTRDLYYYTDQLLSLNSTSINTSHRLISYLSLSANSPLILSQWQHELHHHPDKRYTKYILQEIEEGFKIGFSDSHILQPSTSNLPTPNPSVITDYLAKEVFLNRMWKYPLNAAPQGIHISPVGAILKKNKPGKYRLIIDLSSPKNFSVNDGIDPALSSLSYASIDHLS